MNRRWNLWWYFTYATVSALAVACFSAVHPALLHGDDQEKSASKPASQQAEDEEADALDQAFQVSPTDPQALIKSLEDFLKRFPESARREKVLRLIYRRAIESNDPRKASEAAARLVELRPHDPELLSAAADSLDRLGDAASRDKAISYATRLVEEAEKMTPESRPPEVPLEKYPEYEAVMRAMAYSMRGRFYAKSGANGQAVADLEKSLAVYPSPLVAERLGDAAMKQGDNDRAIDAYATAFAIPDKRVDPTQRDQVRKKLGSAYVARYQSEKGLGDLVLARYDELMQALASRFRSAETPGADIRDPVDLPLQKLDGSPAKLSDFRGKFVVMEFWATWCPPCRVEGKLFEQVMEGFRDEPRVVFLSVNADEDRSLVPDFVKEEGWTATVVYAQGLDQLLGIRALPTVMIMDPSGRVVFRQTGLDLTTFVETLQEKIREALKQIE